MTQVPEPPVMLEIKQGQIIINSAWVVAQALDMVVWEIDLKSKYPDGYVVRSWGDDDRDGDLEETIGVRLFAGSGTVRSDTTTDNPTMINAKMPDGERWHLIADWSRYTVRLAYYKKPNDLSSSGLAIINMEEATT